MRHHSNVCWEKSPGNACRRRCEPASATRLSRLTTAANSKSSAPARSGASSPGFVSCSVLRSCRVPVLTFPQWSEWDRPREAWPGTGNIAGRRALGTSSVQVIQPDGTLVEALPARLCMPLDVYESAGVLHFVSRGYYFRLGDWRLWLPHWLSRGTTHVEHEDEGSGWFRFTLTVRHPLFGELFYQTGRFCAAGASTCSACLP